MSYKIEKKHVFLSVVIPCFNESVSIGEVVSKTRYICQKQQYTYEIIVVDNCSTDNSAEIARKAGAAVITSNAKTVGAVRNKGVKSASGDLLLFLDADVVLGDRWGKRLSQISGAVIEGRVIAGSHCSVPPSLNGVFRPWYLQIEQSSRDTHVGSGHMLVSSMLFRELDGFDENLKSGEDYDLCERASSLGCKIWIDTELVAYHHGYPETIGGFFRRERWHGMGDVTSISKVAHSKVAIAALLFGLLHLALITSLFFGLAETMVSFGSIFCLCVLVIIYKFNLCSPTLILKLVPAVYFYLLGRLFAFAPTNR